MTIFKHLKAFTFCISCAAAAPVQAATVSVDWTPDGIADGIATGVFTSTGTVAANLGDTTVSLTSSLGGINGGSTFVPGGLNYLFSDYAGSLPGLRDTFNQPFTDANGQPLVRNEIGTFDWLNNQPGFVELDFGGKFLRDPILVFSFIQGQSAYDFADDVDVRILGQTFAGNATVGPGNVVAGTGFFGGPSAGLSISLTGVFDALRFETNVVGAAATANGLTVLVEESNILLEAPVSAVPVPPALPLLLTAFAGLGLLARHRRNTV